jgi:methionine-gamma-lyase
MSVAKNFGLDTVCIHGGHREESNRAHLTPIYASSTYTFESTEQAAAIFQGEEKGYVYGRFGNPTINEAEEKIALLEAYGLKDAEGEPLRLKAILHASGMAAITTMLFSNLKAGDKIITHLSLYGGTQEMIDKILPNLGIEAVIVNFHDLDAVGKAILSDNSIKLMYIETPANPTLQCVDLAALAALGKAHNLIVCADNTFATPYLQQPFRYEVDFVMHSTTKFLNGHGTAVGGVLVGRDLGRMNSIVTKTHRLLGGNSNAFEAFLLTNGLRTFSLRMERHCSNAQQVATFLSKHTAVSKVNYLGLEDHPDHQIAMKQMKHAGAMLSFELKGGYEAGVQFMNNLQLCTNAVSLGTCDTLVSHPASTTHVGVPKEKRIEFGIIDGLIRMSVGLENIEDIMADLEQSLHIINNNK